MFFGQIGYLFDGNRVGPEEEPGYYSRKYGDPIMITDREKTTIRNLARKYRASRVLLFGSALSAEAESRDIDIAVEGIADRDFFAFYGELICSLSKPVDLVDLSQENKFIDLVLKEGVSLYT